MERYGSVRYIKLIDYLFTIEDISGYMRKKSRYSFNSGSKYR